MYNMSNNKNASCAVKFKLYLRKQPDCPMNQMNQTRCFLLSASAFCLQLQHPPQLPSCSVQVHTTYHKQNIFR